MSGINTLIDTLMHSVLGKRVDTPPPKDLNEPVRPLSPTEAPLAVRSDSKLEPGRVPLQELPTSPAKRGSQPLPGSASPPSSIQSSFSPAARAIAEVLARFPSPPSVLSAAAPLVETGEKPTSAEIAIRLQSSIGESGLFYEQHLNRWYRGEMSLQQLAREPQMQSQQRLQSQFAAAPEASGTGASAERAAASVLGSEARSGDAGRAAMFLAAGQQAPVKPATAPGVLEVDHLQDRDGAVNRASSENEQRFVGSRGELPEPLQAIVRHQLELLSVPVLRWEGDIWSGLFLALIIQMPEQAKHRESSDDSEPGDEQEQAWRSGLKLKVQGLGDVSVDIRLLHDQVNLQMSVHDTGTLARLEAGRDHLEERLKACGFQAPVIRFFLEEAHLDPESDEAVAGQIATNDERGHD